MLTRVRLPASTTPARQVLPKPRIKLMVDSGAFSAWQSGTKVDFKAYIAWLKQHESRLFSYVALDVLPEEKAGAVSPDDCARASDANLQRMLDAGLQPIPVFHQDEPFKWLAKMVEDGHPYIGLGGSATAPLWKRERWFNEVFTLLCDKQGRPCVRTHGFGIGALELIWNYPFYTVDNTSWILGGAAYGRVLVPHSEKNGRSASIHVGRMYHPTQHVRRMNKQLKDVEKYMKAAGVTISDTSRSYISRARISQSVIEDMEAKLAAQPCVFNRWVSRLDNGWEAFKELPPMQAIPAFKLKIFTVAWGNVMNHVLNEIGHSHRLMSYLNIAKWNDREMDRYIRTGFPAPYVYKGRN